MPTLEEIRARFSSDHYAIEVTGIAIQDAQAGYAVCVLPLREDLLNINHKPMGGAIFTLADFTFAVAANGHSQRLLFPARLHHLPGSGQGGDPGGQGEVPESRAAHLPIRGGYHR